MAVYKLDEFAKMINVSVRTLQRWDNEGTLKAHRNPKGRRYYTDKDYDDYMRKGEEALNDGQRNNRHTGEKA